MWTPKNLLYMTHQGHLSAFFWVMNLSVEVLWRLVQSDMIMHSLHQELGHQKSKTAICAALWKSCLVRVDATTMNQQVMLFMWFLYYTNHLRIMAVWNEAQGVVRKMLQCLEEYEKVFWGAETASFAGSLTYIFFNLQSHWRIWRTEEYGKTWNMDMVFSTISSLSISESRAFFAIHRTPVLPMLEASTFFSCIASSLCHQKQQIPLEGDCVSLGLSSYSGGSLLGKELSFICFFLKLWPVWSAGFSLLEI